MGVFDYDTNPAGNSDTPPNGFPEGMNASDVNDSARQLMADIATFLRAIPWLDLSAGATLVRNSGTEAEFTGVNLTASYSTGRRIRMIGSGTVYGQITNSQFTGGDTVLTIAGDGGASVPTSLSSISVSTVDELAMGVSSSSAGLQIPRADSSGQIASGYIPDLPTSKITSGTFADARIAQTNVTQHQAALALAASQTTSGTFADARIPSLATSKITSGTFADARISQSSVTQHAVAAAKGWVFLDEQSALGASEVDFESLISSAYDVYRIEFTSVVPGTDIVDMQLRFSTNNGSSYISSNYDSVAMGFAVGGSITGGGGNATSEITLTFGGIIRVGNATAQEAVTGWVEFDRGGTGFYPRLQAFTCFRNSGGVNFTTVTTSGQYKGATGAINAARIFMSSGTITGRFRLYGMSKS